MVRRRRPRAAPPSASPRPFQIVTNGGEGAERQGWRKNNATAAEGATPPGPPTGVSRVTRTSGYELAGVSSPNTSGEGVEADVGSARRRVSGGGKFHELPAHRVIMCARAEYCRAALSLQYGFAESGAGGEPGTGSGTDDDDDDDDDANSSGGGRAQTSVSTPEALAALRRVLYTEFSRNPRLRRRRHLGPQPSWARLGVRISHAQGRGSRVHRATRQGPRPGWRRGWGRCRRPRRRWKGATG